MEFNPFAPAVQQNPYPYFAHLRKHSPVYWVEPLQSWAVSRYEDVAYVAKNTQIFSSAPIIPAILGDQNPVPEVSWLISADPPEHTHLRKLVSKAFTPRMVGALEPRIKEIVAQLLDRIEEQAGEFDLVQDFSTPVPLMVIAEMLGVEPDRYREFKQWSDDMIRATGGAEVSPAERERLRGSMDDLRRYFEQTIEERRRSSGGEDLISALVRAEEEREALTAREVLAMCLLLLLGGNETTTNLIGNTVMTLLSHPDELAKVRGDLAIVPQMVEEMLRYEAPAQALLRVATTDTEIAGKAIRAGSGIMILYGSANRDERRFPNPDTFDVMRNPRDHLAFGFGIHHCIGAPLARLEARIAMDGFLRRFPRIQLSNQPREWIDSFVMRGPKSLLLQLS
jgi:cytochrome P450